MKTLSDLNGGHVMREWIALCFDHSIKKDKDEVSACVDLFL